MTVKKKITIGILLLMLGLIVVILFCSIRPSYVGTISRDFSEPTNQRGTITISGSEGEYLTFKFSSTILEGDLTLSVVDSDDNMIASLSEDIEEQKIVLGKDDKYTIVALSESLVGKFKLKVYKN